MTGITLVGNLTGDPELRFTPKGDAQAVFTLAVNERVKQGEEWVDGEAAFYRVTAWRKLGEQAAEHLRKGQRAIIVGKLRPRSYETKEGQTRLSLEVTADEIGPSIRWERKADRASVRADEFAPF